MDGVAYALGALPAGGFSEVADSGIGLLIPGIVFIGLYFILKRILKNRLHFGIFSIILGALGAVFMLTQTKSLLGFRYIGTFDKGFQVNDTMFFLAWALVAALIINGIYYIIVDFQQTRAVEKEHEQKYDSCPMCGESILKTAKKCKHCQHLLSEEEIQSIAP